MRIINTEEFNQIHTTGAVLVDLYADWCGPCKMIAPMLDELSSKYEGQVTFVKVNVDNDPEVAQRFGVVSIPTLITFKDGKLIKQVTGYQPKPMLEKLVSEIL
ncbi:MAG: thioredoxin [Erysipelotrichaceae bacterium]|nr:thioredoxin [Erysipelotrichaceae bacterium]MBQ4343939.1 thioredoxin [Erysipelotrichaceae bacterium]